MALSSMISKASPSVVPLALRAISSTGFLHGSIVTAAVNADSEHVLHNGGISGTFVQSHQFSTVAQATKLIDSSLLKVLRSEIKLAKKYDVAKQELPKVPSTFPFKITDKPGERTITLIRDFPDETIEVEVRRAPVQEMVVEEDDSDDSSSEDDNEDDCNNNNKDDRQEEKDGNEKSSKNDENSDSDGTDDYSDDDSDNSSGEDSEDSPEEKKEPPSLPMTVTVHKNDGRRFKFELGASLDEIKVKHMSIEEYAGSESDSKVEFTAPDFEKLDGDLQHSLLKYLEIRGIKANVIAFLHKYMAAKSYKDDILWLNKLKKFVKK